MGDFGRDPESDEISRSNSMIRTRSPMENTRNQRYEAQRQDTFRREVATSGGVLSNDNAVRFSGRFDKYSRTHRKRHKVELVSVSSIRVVPSCLSPVSALIGGQSRLIQCCG